MTNTLDEILYTYRFFVLVKTYSLKKLTLKSTIGFNYNIVSLLLLISLLVLYQYPKPTRVSSEILRG